MRPTLHQRIEREAYFINQRTGWSADRCWHEAERRVLARSNRTRNGNNTKRRIREQGFTSKSALLQFITEGLPHAH